MPRGSFTRPRQSLTPAHREAAEARRREQSNWITGRIHFGCGRASGILGAVSEAKYLPPPWGARVIGNRMARLFARNVLSMLSVRGRRSGEWRSVPVAVLAHEGERYLIAPRGNTDWSRNLRAAGTGRLRRRGRTEEFDAVEVPVQQRPPLIEVYLAQFGRFPTVEATFRELPDPADHPTFRIVSQT